MGANTATQIAIPMPMVSLLRKKTQALVMGSTSLSSKFFCSFSSSSSSIENKPRKLILYSKPGCCLCDGLEEKLQTAFSLSSPDSLHDVELQVASSVITLSGSFFFLFLEKLLIELTLFWLGINWVLKLDEGHHYKSGMGKGLPV